MEIRHHRSQWLFKSQRLKKPRAAGCAACSNKAGQGSFGNSDGAANSTTVAAISGLAGNAAARTGDVETGIQPIFNKDEAKQEVNAQIAITQEAGKRIPKAIGDQMGRKRDELKAQAKTEPDTDKKAALLAEAAKYDEGGIYHVAAHTALGALVGGADGALGAAASSAAAPALDTIQRQLQTALQDAGMSAEASQQVASLSTGALAATLGATAGGTAGAATAFNADMNNRQLHPDQLKRIQKLGGDPKKQEQLTAVLCVLQNCDIDGLSGYDTQGQAVLEAGKQILINDPELFRRLANEVQGAGLLSGEFAYLPGGVDFTKDAFGKYIDDKVQGVKDIYDLAKRKPDDLGSLAKGAVKGLANNVKDAPQYPLDGADEKQGAILANTALVVGPAAAAAGAGTLNAMGRAWEAGKVLNAGEIGMSSGGNISAQQITRVGTPAGLSTAEMNTLSHLDSLSSDVADALRETVSNSYFERNGFKAMDGKCGAGNCFDGVYIKGDQVIVNEVKPLKADGSIKLSPGDSNTKLPTQGTLDWVKNRAQALIDTKDPVKVQVGRLIQEADRAGKLTTTISGVNSSGMVIVKVKP